MPNWSSGAFCGKDHAYYKFDVSSLICPMNSHGCKFTVSGKVKNPIGAMQEHFKGKEPHNNVEVFYCFACGMNLASSGELSNHCPVNGHPKPTQANFAAVPADGTFMMIDSQPLQPNAKNKPKPVVAPKVEYVPYTCFVCGISRPKQSDINTHFLRIHRLGVFSCSFKDCKKEKVTFDNLYSASVHFNNTHSLHALLRNGRVRRRC